MPLLRKAPSAMKGLFGFIPLPYSKESRIKDRSDSSAVCSPRSRSPSHSGFLGWESKSFVCRSKCVDRDATFKKASSAMKRLFLFYIISNGRIVSFKVEINSSLSHLSRFFGTHSHSGFLGRESKSLVCRSKCVDRDANFKKSLFSNEEAFFVLYHFKWKDSIKIKSPLSHLFQSFGTPT
jgi:hypothetical protein